jgi:hypothetical protein
MSRSARNAPARPRPSSRAGWLPRLAVFTLPSAFFLAVGFWFFTSTGRDDSHITYWPAYTLARFGEILNYNGERVEQSSSLLHVLLLATSCKLTGVEVVTLGKLSSILAGVGTLLLLYALVRKIADRVVAFAGTLLAAACAYFIYWAFGGMETTLVSLTGVWLILSLGNYVDRTETTSRVRPVLPPVFAMSAFALVRPESPFLMIGMLVAATLISLRDIPANEPTLRTLRGRLLTLLGAAAAICSLLFAFRLLYFGSAFPQPVAAKYAGLSAASFTNGLRYLATNVFEIGPGIAVPIVAAGLACGVLAVLDWRSKRFPSYANFTLLFVAGYVAFIIFSGGDWMEGGRFLVPFLPLALALVPVVLAKSLPGNKRRPLVVALSATVLVSLEVASVLSFARDESFGTRRWRDMDVAQVYDVTAYSWFEKHNRINMRDVPVIAYINDLIPKIEAIRPGAVVLMTGQMGMVPYHVARKNFGRVRFLDRRGLCDRMLTDCDLSRKLARDAAGLRMEYIEYFEMREQIEERCGLPRPDIIFDMHGGNQQIVSENGHRTVAKHSGTISDRTGIGGEVLATGFVAIPDELYATLAAADSTRNASRAR